MPAKTLTAQEAIAAFQAVQTKYQEFGARDTEPRTEFVLMLERIAEGKDPAVPTVGQPSYFGGKDNNPWDLYSSMKGNFFANKALTAAAKKVVKAAESDRAGLLTWLQDNYGYRPF